MILNEMENDVTFSVEKSERFHKRANRALEHPLMTIIF